jgi:hypothetical protein
MTITITIASPVSTFMSISLGHICTIPLFLICSFFNPSVLWGLPKP